MSRGRSGRRFTTQFKRAAAELSRQPAITVQRAAAELDIPGIHPFAAPRYTASGGRAPPFQEPTDVRARRHHHL